jgi:membrane protein YqaA with SNARE-associated domain
VFPIPADVLFIPMVLAKPDQAWRFALIATVTSVLGGVFGWMIGHYAFDLVAAPLLEFYGKMAAFDTLKSQTGDTAILVMLVTSGLTHLPPMKVVTILSGLVSFDLKWFILSAIVARGGRFYLLAYLLQRYGQAMAVFIEKRMALIGLAVLGLVVLVWVGLKVMG